MEKPLEVLRKIAASTVQTAPPPRTDRQLRDTFDAVHYLLVRFPRTQNAQQIAELLPLVALFGDPQEGVIRQTEAMLQAVVSVSTDEEHWTTLLLDHTSWEDRATKRGHQGRYRNQKLEQDKPFIYSSVYQLAGLIAAVVDAQAADSWKDPSASVLPSWRPTNQAEWDRALERLKRFMDGPNVHFECVTAVRVLSRIWVPKRYDIHTVPGALGFDRFRGGAPTVLIGLDWGPYDLSDLLRIVSLVNDFVSSIFDLEHRASVFCLCAIVERGERLDI